MRVGTRHNPLRAGSLGGKFASGSPRSSPDHRQQHQLLQQQYQQLQEQQIQLQQQHAHFQQQRQQLLQHYQLQQQQQQQQQHQQQQIQTQQLQQPQQQQQQPQHHQGDDAVVAPFSSCEPNSSPDAGPDQQGSSMILGDRFLLFSPAEGSTLYRCVDSHTGEQLVAKAIVPGEKSSEALLQAQMRLEGSGAASAVAGLVDAAGARKRYLLLEGHHGDLHAYVRARRRLREPEARWLFKQAAMAVATCHEHGVVLRDLKLRKFVFADEARTKLQLESLEDAVLVEPSDDLLSDRRGCPAYVAPEVLRSGRAYSGKAADIWSLGVLLYTMLVGRYPFNDAEHASLFAKISRGHFAVPEGLSPRARCLVKALLRRDPAERPAAEDVLRHPWLTRPLSTPGAAGGAAAAAAATGAVAGNNHHQPGHHRGTGADSQDQIVPDLSSPR